VRNVGWADPPGEYCSPFGDVSRDDLAGVVGAGNLQRELRPRTRSGLHARAAVHSGARLVGGRRKVEALRAPDRLVSRDRGLAPIPCGLAELEPDLVRVAPLPDDFTLDLWLPTHEDLRQTARIRGFLDFLAKALGREAPLLKGLGRQDVDPISDALAQGAERAPSIRR
jgi:DNA-binding transcriptional LysR family regulator